jgi:MFS family permease
MLQRFLKNYLQSFSGLPRGVWFLSLAVLINRSGTMVMFFLSLYVTTQLDFSVIQAGSLVTYYGLGAIGGAFAGGWASDKIAPKTVQIWSLIATGLGFIVLGQLGSYNDFVFGMLVQGFVAETFRPANAKAIGLITNATNRSRSFALNRLAINMGMAIGPAVGGIMATYNYTYLFWADGLTCVVSGILLALLYKKMTGLFTAKESAEEQKEQKRQTIVLNLTVIFFVMFIFGLIFTQVFNTWPLYLKNINGFDEDIIGYLLGLNAVLVTIFEMPLVHRYENSNLVRVMAAGAVFFVGGFVLLPVDPALWFVVLTVVIWSIGEMLVFPIATAFIANQSTPDNLGRIMGVFSFTFGLSMAVGPAIGSYIYDKVSPNMLWYSVGFAGLFILMGYFLLDRLAKRKNNV